MAYSFARHDCTLITTIMSQHTRVPFLLLCVVAFLQGLLCA